jgi:hypothetical protein
MAHAVDSILVLILLGMEDRAIEGLYRLKYFIFVSFLKFVNFKR